MGVFTCSAAGAIKATTPYRRSRLDQDRSTRMPHAYLLAGFRG